MIAGVKKTDVIETESTKDKVKYKRELRNENSRQ